MPLADPPDEPTFYMTVNANLRQLEPLIGDGQTPVMRNVMTFRNSDSLRVTDPVADRYVLDSGGYTAMQEFGGDFPWSVTDYHEWARDMYAGHPFEWVAAMDLACEGAFDDDISVAQRVDQTIENTLALLDHDPEYPVLPVLQGRTVDEWVGCYDRLRDHGVDPEYAGVGTLCRQTSGKDIAAILQALRARTDIDVFHGFGVKATAFSHGASFWTADSNAWARPLQFGDKYHLNGDGLSRVPYGEHTGETHRETFSAYYGHVHDLHRTAHARHDPTHEHTTLGDFA